MKALFFGLLPVWIFCIAGLTQAQQAAVSTGVLHQINQFPSAYVPSRDLYVWLPEGYDESQKYPLLVMQDGNMLFDSTVTWNGQEWGADEVAGALIADGSLEPFIILGIANAGDARHSEYFPEKPFKQLSAQQQAFFYAREREPGVALFSTQVYSDEYLKFLVEEALPYVRAHYSVAEGAAATKMLGSSMGGLISLYALCEYPENFSAIAAMSTHWPGVLLLPVSDNPIPEKFITYLESCLPGLTDQRIYFDLGTETLDAFYPELQQRVDRMLRDQAYPQELWQTQVFPGADHTEDAWRERLAIPLKFLFAEPENGL